MRPRIEFSTGKEGAAGAEVFAVSQRARFGVHSHLKRFGLGATDWAQQGRAFDAATASGAAGRVGVATNLVRALMSHEARLSREGGVIASRAHRSLDV